MYVKSFAQSPKKKDIPAMYFEVEGVKGSSIPEAHTPRDEDKRYKRDIDKDVFGFYTARFDKCQCGNCKFNDSGKIKIILEDPEHSSGREYTEHMVSCDDIYVARIDGGGPIKKGSTYEFEPFEPIDDIEDDKEILMFPFFRLNEDEMLRRITWADVDGDGRLENIIAANKEKKFFYIDYHDVVPEYLDTVAGSIQIDTDYLNVYPWDTTTRHWVDHSGPPGSPGYWEETSIERPVTLEHKQGLIQNFEKQIQYSPIRTSRIYLMMREGELRSHTTSLFATQRVIHKIKLNDGRVLDIPADFKVSKSSLYSW
jgi:hypothetical protein